MRIAPFLAALALAATALPAAAQSPAPTASSPVMGVHKVPVSSLHNSGPNSSRNTHTMSGQGCNSGPTSVRAQNVSNPINGKAQAAPIVSIPISKGGGSVAAATNHAQQTQACAHTR